MLVWVEIEELDELSLWEGDRSFLRLVFDTDPRQFHGVMPYRDGHMLSWAYSRI
jgi:8-oxo-dGTP diphosphatase